MRPWHYWITFAVCVGVLFAALGWVSVTTLNLEKTQAEARQRSAFEENVRLALWRMETAVTAILARESARPYFVYSAFYPAERAYNRMYQEIPNWDVLVPSPLLQEPTPQVILHFQIGPDGSVSSPEVAEGRMLELSAKAFRNTARIRAVGQKLGELREKLKRDTLLAMLPENKMTEDPPVYLAMDNVNSVSNAVVNNDNNAQMDAVAGVQGQWTANQPVQQIYQQAVKQEMARNSYEYNLRSLQQREIQAAQKKQMNPQQKTIRSEIAELDTMFPAVPVVEGAMKAIWVRDALILVRRVTVNGEDYLQGCWLDWPQIRQALLGRIRDLLRDPDLIPVSGDPGTMGARMLAGIPVRLTAVATSGGVVLTLTPVTLMLVVAWCGVLLASAAVAVLLAGAISLSERRGAFVSAVTHELRTPLTTFRMYSEMLAEGMITDEAKKKRYLETLCAEGSRLSHLVENVLSFARLERGRHRGQMENVAIRAIFDRVRDRLAQRAEQAGMTLVVECPDDTLSAEVRTDLGAVEQILFNLVDNASKYAAKAEDRRIHLEAGRTDGRVFLRVRDHGPGVEKVELRRLFRPFHKSAKHAAESAPGVGLGLALSRRLARQMKGDLRICPDHPDGACFELHLPAQ